MARIEETLRIFTGRLRALYKCAKQGRYTQQETWIDICEFQIESPISKRSFLFFTAKTQDILPLLIIVQHKIKYLSSVEGLVNKDIVTAQSIKCYRKCHSSLNLVVGI